MVLKITQFYFCYLKQYQIKIFWVVNGNGSRSTMTPEAFFPKLSPKHTVLLIFVVIGLSIKCLNYSAFKRV